MVGQGIHIDNITGEVFVRQNFGIHLKYINVKYVINISG